MVAGPERHATFGRHEHEPIVDAIVARRPRRDHRDGPGDERNCEHRHAAEDQPQNRQGQEEQHRRANQHGGARQETSSERQCTACAIRPVRIRPVDR